MVFFSWGFIGEENYCEYIKEFTNDILDTSNPPPHLPINQHTL